jgi:hypothetical protein
MHLAPNFVVTRVIQLTSRHDPRGISPKINNAFALCCGTHVVNKNDPPRFPSVHMEFRY